MSNGNLILRIHPNNHSAHNLTHIIAIKTDIRRLANPQAVLRRRLQDGKYELFLESLPMQQFTGSIGADGASVSIESVTGLVQEGVLAENGSEIIANTTLETDPICLVSWVYEEEAGRYDVVLDQYVYSSAMHIAGVAMCHTQLCFSDGEFSVVRQWADLR